jgi:AdoMet-dependent heme synthase
MGLRSATKVVKTAAETLKKWSDLYEIEFSPSFTLTGGEPLLSRHLFEIMGQVKSAGFEIYLLTNGTLVDDERAMMLADVPVEGVQVSIEGLEPVHESIRGKGTFSSALKGVKHLVDAGITVTLNVTLWEFNYRDLKSLVSLAASVGAQRLGFSRLVPHGRGLGLLQQMLSPATLKAVYEEINELRDDHVQIVTGDPLASQVGLEPESTDSNIPSGGCAAGISGLTILSDGTLMPCRRLALPIGNILRDSLRTIWATSPVLQSLRSRAGYSGKCRHCSRWSRCRGCRAIAFAYSSAHGSPDPLSEDPQCFFEDMLELT